MNFPEACMDRKIQKTGYPRMYRKLEAPPRIELGLPV
jgi:hypothetical protein